MTLTEQIVAVVTFIFSSAATVFMIGRKTGKLEDRVETLEKQVRAIEEDTDQILHEIKEELRIIREDIKTILVSKADKK